MPTFSNYCDVISKLQSKDTTYYVKMVHRRGFELLGVLRDVITTATSALIESSLSQQITGTKLTKP